MFKPTTVYVYVMEMNSTTSVNPNSGITITLENMIDVAYQTFRAPTKTVTLLNTSGSAVSGTSMRSALDVALNATGLVSSKAGPNTVYFSYIFPDVGAFPAVTLTRNDSVVAWTGVLQAAPPSFGVYVDHATAMEQNYNLAVEELNASGAQVVTLEEQVASLQAQLAAAGGSGGSGAPGSTVVNVLPPEKASVTQLALAGLAGFALGKAGAVPPAKKQEGQQGEYSY